MNKKTFIIIYIIIILVFLNSIDVSATAHTTNNLIIALDPGHGGEETGATYYGLEEKNLNLSLARMLLEELEEYEGVTTILTRTEDEEVSLFERGRRASEQHANMLISLHFNASVSHTSNGASIYLSTGAYHKDELMRLGDSFLGEFEAIGLSNAGMFARVTQMNGRRSDGSFDDYYGVLRHAYNQGIPAMIVEHCYMDSEIDKPYFSTEEGLRKLAIADATAIAAYYNLHKKGEEAPSPKHAAVFGATTKAVEMNYYEAPRLESVALTEYDGKSPGIATYEIEVTDDIGITTIYLVYKNITDGTSFTIYANLEEPLLTGTANITTYFPSHLEPGDYQLAYVGLYNKVGFDAGYNRYNGTLVGYGKCDWLNTFPYSTEADLTIAEQTTISPIRTHHITEGIREHLRTRKHIVFLSPSHQ